MVTVPGLLRSPFRILYINDNSIADIADLTGLSKLELINVSNNEISSLSVLRNYTGTLTEIYAENNKLTDFSFVNGASNLHILMLSGNDTTLAQDNMVTWLSGLNEMEVLTLSGIRLNDLSFLSSMDNLVRLDVAGCGLSVFSGERSNIEAIAGRYAKLRVLDARWTVNSYTVSWNTGTGYTIAVKRTSSPNAGAATGTLSSGETVYYGDVLSVTYTRSDFYKITSNGATSITVAGNVTSSQIYATAEQNPLSDWVKASEVPSGAKIEYRKWTYTLREYTTSSSSTLSGYTLYDTQRTGWGATQGPVYSDPSNGSRNVWSEQYVTSSNYKTVYHYFRYSTGQYASGGSDKSTSTYGTTYYAYDFDYELTNTGSSGNYSVGYKYYYTAATGNTVSGKYITVWKCDPFTTQEWVSDNYGTRWYYQEPVYTYYFYRDVSKEATSNPTGQSNVSNVVEWVQYRAK